MQELLHNIQKQLDERLMNKGSTCKSQKSYYFFRNNINNMLTDITFNYKNTKLIHENCEKSKEAPLYVFFSF